MKTEGLIGLAIFVMVFGLYLGFEAWRDAPRYPVMPTTNAQSQSETRTNVLLSTPTPPQAETSVAPRGPLLDGLPKELWNNQGVILAHMKAVDGQNYAETTKLQNQLQAKLGDQDYDRFFTWYKGWFERKHLLPRGITLKMLGKPAEERGEALAQTNAQPPPPLAEIKRAGLIRP